LRKNSPLDSLSFHRIKDYLACLKKLQLKLRECGKDFKKKEGQSIDLSLVNLIALYNSFDSTFQAVNASRKKMARTSLLLLFAHFLSRSKTSLSREENSTTTRSSLQ
jgi:hypothetical protein